MLGFILSKINLLILVTAIFAVVAFFALGLTDITKVKEASELVFRISEKSFALVSSSTYCAGDAYTLQPDISVAGSSFYYVLKVSKEQVQAGQGGRETFNLLIFSVYPREEVKKSFVDSLYVPKAIAANSFRTSAELHLLSRMYVEGKDYTDGLDPKSGFDDLPEFYADPQAINPVDTLQFIKEVKGGKTSLYVVGCNSALCEAHLDRIRSGGFPCQKRRSVSSI